MAKQLPTNTVKILMLDGEVARFIERDGCHQWVIGLQAKPCGTAIRALAGKAWLWMTQGDHGTTAGLNATGKTRARLGY